MACDLFDAGVAHWFSIGLASWFCCGSIYSPYCTTSQNSGACGTCDNYDVACAWPYLNGYPSNYAASCRPSLPPYACGEVMRVVSYCQTTYVFPYIADHGPYTDHFCGVSSPCRADLGCNDRIIDLTPAAFMELASLSVGLTKVYVDPCDCF